MGHAISMVKEGQAMFVYNRQGGLPWWESSTLVGRGEEGPLTVKRILEGPELDWEVHAAPVFDETGQELPGYQRSYRVGPASGEQILFGVMRKRWRAFQNRDFLRTMDRLVGAGNMVWETAGALFDGKKVFASIDLNQVPDLDKLTSLPNGEKLAVYLIGTNGHAGQTGLEFFTSTTRPVCANTVAWAKESAINWSRIVHTGNLEERVAEIREAMGLKFKGLKWALEDCQRLVTVDATTTTARDVVDTWLEQLFPMDTDHEATKTRRRKAREIVVELAHHGRGNDARTLWSWYNGFTEWMDGNLPLAVRENDAAAKDRFLDSNMGGARNDKRNEARWDLIARATDAEILAPAFVNTAGVIGR